MWAVVKDAVVRYQHHEDAILAAALAFYVLLATAPAGVFALAVVGAVFGEDAARGELVTPLAHTVGIEVAAYVSETIDRMNQRESTFLATALGALVFFVATTRVFLMLQAGLNQIWGVRPTVDLSLRGSGLRLLERRMLSGLMVLFCGLTFVLFVAVKTGITVASHRFFDVPFVLKALEFVLSWGVLSGVVAVVFRYMPDARIVWEDAFVGAAVTSLLASVGAMIAGQYVGGVAITTAYGAAGSLVAFLLWVYYCAQIFFLGAEFTCAWARHRGAGVTPLPHARVVSVSEARVSLLSHPDEVA